MARTVVSVLPATARAQSLEASREKELPKCVLLGHDNPRSADPAHALYPSPPNCAGARLWRCLADVGGHTRGQYARGFDRRNLFAWPGGVAQFAPPARGGTVVVLGQQVSRALGLGPQLVAPQQRAGVTYRVLPHPSGRNPWYNDEMHRLVAGLLLEELIDEKEKEEAVTRPGGR